MSRKLSIFPTVDCPSPKKLTKRKPLMHSGEQKTMVLHPNVLLWEIHCGLAFFYASTRSLANSAFFKKISAGIIFDFLAQIAASRGTLKLENCQGVGF